MGVFGKDLIFGDIIDARKHPSVGHFILIVGLFNNDLLYYCITSRIYKAFPKLVDFFNRECIDIKCQKFVHWFKDKDRFCVQSPLSDILFFDHSEDYNLLLDEDSMVVINRDPSKMGINIYDDSSDQKLVAYKGLITKKDFLKLLVIVKDNNNLSEYWRSKIKENIISAKVKRNF